MIKTNIQNYIQNNDIIFKLVIFGIIFSIIIGIVFGLNYLLDYLDSIGMLDDSVRDNIGAIIFGVFAQ
jgi:hypothetical protein